METTGVAAAVLESLPEAAAVFVLSYLVGAIPWAYIIVRLVTGEDITTHGTGNVGAMNVRRTTGSWAWFTADMVLDGLKGLLPVAVVKTAATVAFFTPAGPLLRDPMTTAVAVSALAAMAGAVIGHIYSGWLALVKKRLVRTGKGLATGAGALLAYDWRYFLAVLVVGLAMIAITRYMMAGQVAAALTLPLAALALGSPDWPVMLLLGLIVYGAHHRRFVGLLQGKEPKLYVHDRQGPRG